MEVASRDRSTQTEACSVSDMQDYVRFLQVASPQRRRKVFCTTKSKIACSLEAGADTECSRCLFTNYVYELFAHPEKKQAWLLPPGELMQLMSPQKLVNPLNFLWKDDCVHLADSLVNDETAKLLTTFLAESVEHLGSIGCRPECLHTRESPSPIELDCSLRRLREQEQEFKRLDAFCDQLLCDAPEALPGEGGAEPSTSVDAAFDAAAEALDESSELNTSCATFEEQLRHFEYQLESDLGSSGPSKSSLNLLRSHIQFVTKQIVARRQRLEAACCHGIRTGHATLIKHVLGLCWDTLISEFFAQKSLQKAFKLRESAADLDACPSDLLRRENESREASYAESKLKERVAQAEDKVKEMQKSLRDSEKTVEDLTQRMNKVLFFVPDEEMDALSDGDVDACIEEAQRALRALQLRKAKRQIDAERQNLTKCVVCWANSKEIAFTCGHQTCNQCSAHLTACPICREEITMRIKLY